MAWILNRSCKEIESSVNLGGDMKGGKRVEAFKEGFEDEIIPSRVVVLNVTT